MAIMCKLCVCLKTVLTQSNFVMVMIKMTRGQFNKLISTVLIVLNSTNIISRQLMKAM